MRIAFFQRPKDIPESFFEKTIRRAAKSEKVTGNLEIVFLSEKQIQKLNLTYRSLNRPTDVLSFAARPTAGFPRNLSERTFGQIVVCGSVVRRHAKKARRPFRKELAWVLIHGLLHLCGYEHEKSEKEAQLMRKKEEQYLGIENG